LLDENRSTLANQADQLLLALGSFDAQGLRPARDRAQGWIVT